MFLSIFYRYWIFLSFLFFFNFFCIKSLLSALRRNLFWERSKADWTKRAKIFTHNSVVVLVMTFPFFISFFLSCVCQNTQWASCMCVYTVLYAIYFRHFCFLYFIIIDFPTLSLLFFFSSCDFGHAIIIVVYIHFLASISFEKLNLIRFALQSSKHINKWKTKGLIHHTHTWICGEVTMKSLSSFPSKA